MAKYEEGSRIWKKMGALEYFECRGDDLEVKGGQMTFLPFTTMTKATKDETVWFSFIVYKSKQHRDEVNAKVMKEMNEKYKDMTMPFDMKRFSYGGFKVVVEG